MRLKKALLIPALCSALFLGSPKQVESESNLNFNLFPEQPIYRTLMADSDILKTQIEVQQGLEKGLLKKPIKDILPYTSLAKTLPLISVDINSKKLLPFISKDVTGHAKIEAFKQGRTLSDKVFSASLIASGQLNFPQNQENDIDYKTRLELFLNSPMIDDYLSDGNKLYIVGGFTGKGSINSKNLSDKNLSQIFDSFIDTYSFSADAYIIPKSPYSDQFLIIRGGVDNLFGNTSEKTNINLSTTWEFPSLLVQSKMFKNFKISPYISTHIKIPIDSESCSKLLGQLGMKAEGESRRSLILYTQADYNEEAEEPWVFSSGLKIDL